MTLNLIIPVYNNKKGLYETLFSLNPLVNFEGFKISIIDDCSTVDTYDDIISTFQNFFNLEILKTPKNGGPGKARQYGIDHSDSEYIMFIDAGDIFSSPFDLKVYFNYIQNNPHFYMFSPTHLEQREDYSMEMMDAGNNRIHGKVYRKDFLEKYNITFNPNCSYIDEDIGFNMACRMICTQIAQNSDIAYICHYETPIVIWTMDMNSLTRTEDFSFYYKQNKGLGLNSIYALNLALQNNVDINLLLFELYETFNCLYVFHIGALNERPECAAESLEGVLHFYENFLRKYPINEELFLQAYNKVIGEFMATENPFNAKLPTMGIVDFMNLLEQLYIKGANKDNVS